MLAKAFNLIAIAALISFIFLVTAFFFLGSHETFSNQLNELPKYFFGRTAGGIVIGILGGVIIGLVNLLLNKITGSRSKISKIVLLTLLLSTIASIIGTGIFFFA
jgi:hypothetical protein